MTDLENRVPSLPWVLPFAAFLLLLGIAPSLGLTPVGDGVLRLVCVGAALWISRGVIPRDAPHWIGSVLVGVGVFVLWVAPDLLIPGWRDHVFFQNRVVGHALTSFPASGQVDPVAILLRMVRAVVLVPVLEELFWRGWLPRWIDDMGDFRRVPLGAYTALSFIGTAVLFASEHGSFWEVGLVAGLVYNAWMWRTKSLGDCILAHAVTNACLSFYVVSGGHWQYW